MGTPSKHFPEEHIADGRLGAGARGRLWILNTMSHAAAELSELENGISALFRRGAAMGSASHADWRCQRASRQSRPVHTDRF
jgi:hypothetical protein